jgi:hypothetical protein
MKFNAILAVFTFAVFASACIHQNCPVPTKRSLSLTNKPREWLNAVRSVNLEASAVEAPTEE